MKKLFVTILAFIYLFEASGMSYYKHFCMDRFVSWGLTKDNKKCHSCGMLKGNPKGNCKGCCKDEHKLVKLSADHKASLSIWPASLFGEPIHVYHIIGFYLPTIESTITSNSIHGPPFVNSVPVYLFNRVFRI